MFKKYFISSGKVVVTDEHKYIYIRKNYLNNDEILNQENIVNCLSEGKAKLEEEYNYCSNSILNFKNLLKYIYKLVFLLIIVNIVLCLFLGILSNTILNKYSLGIIAAETIFLLGGYFLTMGISNKKLKKKMKKLKTDIELINEKLEKEKTKLNDLQKDAVRVFGSKREKTKKLDMPNLNDLLEEYKKEDNKQYTKKM